MVKLFNGELLFRKPKAVPRRYIFIYFRCLAVVNLFSSFIQPGLLAWWVGGDS